MKIVKISTEGTCPPSAKLVKGGKFYALCHGEEGWGRWEVKFPLFAKEFPPNEEYLRLEGDYSLVDLSRKDQRGNHLFLITEGKEDGKFLVLLSQSPGFRGSASYRTEGQITLLCSGEEAQCDAGRMGGTDCPVFVVKGPCQISWTRTGRLYGIPSKWVAIFDGEGWEVVPVSANIRSLEEEALEEAALNY